MPITIFRSILDEQDISCGGTDATPVYTPKFAVDDFSVLGSHYKGVSDPNLKVTFQVSSLVDPSEVDDADWGDHTVLETAFIEDTKWTPKAVTLIQAVSGRYKIERNGGNGVNAQLLIRTLGRRLDQAR